MPAQLNLETSIKFARDLSQIVPASEFAFNARALKWVEPFGMLRVVCAIRDFVQKYHPQTTFTMQCDTSTNAYGYAAFMGFFQACNVPVGNEPGGNPGETYLPITFRKITDLLHSAFHDGERIESISYDLARQLLRETNGYTHSVVAYCFREMIRNVVEHSEAEEIGYCAQYWPTKQKVEIAIVDTGIGLRASLQGNPHLRIHTDDDALKFALFPGVSGKAYQGMQSRSEAPWQNSGYGLYMNYRLCNEGGDFFVCSGKKGLYRTVDASDNEYVSTHFQGTILRLRMRTGQLSNYHELLKRYRNEGEMLARASDYGANLSASAISGYIRDNFQSLHTGIIKGANVRHMQFGVGTVVDIVPANPEYLALVAFYGGRRKRIPISSLLKVDGAMLPPYKGDDIPF